MKFLIIFYLIFSLGTIVMAETNNNELDSLNEPFKLTDLELETYIREAIKDKNMAYRLSMFYAFYKNDNKTAHIWERQAAELGHSMAQYNLANRLFYICYQKSKFQSIPEEIKNLSKQQIFSLLDESQFWAIKAKNQGVTESDTLLKNIEEVRLKFKLDACLQ